jgi:hypothetical protein
MNYNDYRILFYIPASALPWISQFSGCGNPSNWKILNPNDLIFVKRQYFPLIPFERIAPFSALISIALLRAE